MEEKFKDPEIHGSVGGINANEEISNEKEDFKAQDIYPEIKTINEVPQTEILENNQNSTEIYADNQNNEDIKALSTLAQLSTGKADLDLLSNKSLHLPFNDLIPENSISQSLPVVSEVMRDDEIVEDKVEIKSDKTIDLEERDSVKIYCFGSSECDQFPCDDDSFESKRPVYIPFFLAESLKVSKILCGGLHTVALINNGDLYSWGCNDDGVLGRSGPETIPVKIDLEYPVDLISAGDSHTVAANSNFGIMYFWGVYRNTHRGKMSEVTPLPKRIWEKELKNKKVQKLISGFNHTMIMVDSRIYVWGDPETYVLGRMPTAKRRMEQGLKLEGMNHTRGKRIILEIFSGGNHAFFKCIHLKTNENRIYGWGLNNFGQLGIGNTKNTLRPSFVEGLYGHDIVDIKGGEHFSMALTSEGKVFTFGRNEEGQLGIGEEGENYTEPRIVNIPPIKSIFAGPAFCYALSEKNTYSWGNGDRYLLLNGKEEGISTPYEVRYKLLREENLLLVAPGGQHVAIMTGPSISEVNIDFTHHLFEQIQKGKTPNRKRQPSPLKLPTSQKKIKGK